MTPKLHIDPQLNSRLVQAPYDIRSQIFDHLTPQIHIFLHDGILRISDCFSHENIDVPYQCEADHRNPRTRERTTCGYMSAWGPHWRCEEMMLKSLEANGCYGTLDALMKACEKLNLDILDHLGQCTLVVTDLVTLNMLFERSRTFLREIMQNVKSLEIALKLPLDVLLAIELTASDFSTKSGFLGKVKNRDFAWDHADMWLRAGPALDRLEHLRKVRVWIDHKSDDFWFRHDESAILSPLSNLTGRADVALSIHLPRHADDDIPIPPFQIERRQRFGHYPQVCKEGKVLVHRVQFPIYQEPVSKGQRPGPGENAKRERMLWRDGRDMKKALMGIISIEAHCNLVNN